MSKSLVSVVIPTQKRPQRLWKALLSVATQTYPVIEAIVVNDGGVPLDDMMTRYRTIYGLPTTYLAFPENKGLAAARNAGCDAAQGELIALLDDDDCFHQDHIMRLVAALNDSQAVLAYDDVLILVEEGAEADGDQRVIATCRFGLPYDKAIFDQDDYIVPSSVVFRRTAFEAAGKFDTIIPVCEDWDFLLRLREQGDFRYVADDVGVEYSLRLAAGDNLGSTFDIQRRKSLDMLSARYGLPPLAPKTFLDVARDLGFALTPVAEEKG